MASKRPSNMDMYHAMTVAAFDTLLLWGYLHAFKEDKPLTVQLNHREGSAKFKIERTYTIHPDMDDKRGCREDLIRVTLPEYKDFGGLVLKFTLDMHFEIHKMTVVTLSPVEDIEALLAEAVPQVMGWFGRFTATYQTDGSLTNAPIAPEIDCSQL